MWAQKTLGDSNGFWHFEMNFPPRIHGVPQIQGKEFLNKIIWSESPFHPHTTANRDAMTGLLCRCSSLFAVAAVLLLVRANHPPPFFSQRKPQLVPILTNPPPRPVFFTNPPPPPSGLLFTRKPPPVCFIRKKPNWYQCLPTLHNFDDKTPLLYFFFSTKNPNWYRLS